MCERCAELEARAAALEEQVAYLKSELGVAQVGRVTARILAALDKRGKWGGPQIADVIRVLYAAKGSPIPNWRLRDEVPAKSGRDDRCEQLATVWIYRVRQHLGAEAVGTIRSRGYFLTPVGMAKVAAILGDGTQE